ncbi:hypothetical protein DFH08DRAFT_815871 [Mycena albidolilacea]|uniref:Uncharacterized protein n=1 Tax=Mycena albidolilacea TaxID=1033008 RepID=A0AAD6ZLV3_9AGAR|nr:hypothetical protein DFH08DRAFT_815871 [Mycena albidolilacea]
MYAGRGVKDVALAQNNACIGPYVTSDSKQNSVPYKSFKGMSQLQGCNGERPTCRRYRLQPPRSLDPCTYSHAPVGGTVFLQVEESMETMKNRIYQLKLLNGQDPSKVFLEEPYSSQQLQGLAPEPDTWDSLMQFGGIPSPIEVGKPNISAAIPRPNLDLFLHHFARHPFFLDPMQFQQTALLPDLLPCSLLVSVTLWATHTSANPLAESVYSEEELLAQTVHHIAQDIAVGKQTEVFTVFKPL